MRKAIAAIAVLICARAFGANLVPNPSAEEGQQAPRSWRPVPASGGFWQEGGAKFGKRCLGLDAKASPAAWRSLSTRARAVQGYRLSGWIRAEGGTGWIEAHFLNVRRHGLQILRAPRTSDRSWTYVALDIPAGAGEAESVHVECRAEGGRCLFDGIRLEVLDRNILPNPELAPREVDQKPDPSGAPTGWNALPESDVRTVPVTELPASKTRALALGGANPRRAASYICDLPADTRACRLRARVMSSGKVACLISWFGDRGRISGEPLLVGPSAERLDEVWLTASAPAGANRVRAEFALVEGESALVVPESLSPATDPEPGRCRVLVNQVGYEPGAGKSAIVATSHFPGALDQASFALVDDAGKVALKDRLVPLGRVHEGRPDDWGSYYWLADFSQVDEAGQFKVKARVGEQSAESYPVFIRRGVLFQKTAELTYRFLYYQRCGCAVPGWHEACHLDDGRLPDGSHADLAGGWHDAGDYNKWMYPNGPPLVLYGLASAYLAHRAYFDAIDRDGNGRADLLDEILWGADWLMRMRNPKTGGLFGSVTTGWRYWGLPERETDNIPGNADDRPVADEEPSAGLAAAALAKVGQCVGSGEAFTRAAVELETYVRKKERHSADHLLACLAVWQATGRGEYLEEARAAADGIAAAKPGNRQGRSLAALSLFVTAAPGSGKDGEYRRAIEDSLARLAAMQSQPFPLAAGRSGSEKDMEEPSRLGKMGGHMGLTSNAWAALAAARALQSKGAMLAASNELDWLFGMNPLDVCMLEGAGSFNPPRYHHRYFDSPQHRDGAVPGAIPNGIARSELTPSLDFPALDWVRRDAMTVEPWIPYNGYYLCGLSLMDTGD